MELNELKKYAGEALRRNNIKPKTKRAADIIWAFYTGHYVGQDVPPYVVICLMSGRFDDLVDMGDGK